MKYNNRYRNNLNAFDHNASKLNKYFSNILNLLLFLLLINDSYLQAQSSTIYGNEWIKYDQPYVKFYIGRDGMYKISYQDLANLIATPIKGSQIQVWRFGKEVPLFSSNQGIWSTNDYVLLFGEKNRAELDKPLYADPGKEMLNPEYSLSTDTAAYFLTIVPENIFPQRVSIIPSNSNTKIVDYVMVDLLKVFSEYPVDKRYDSQNEIAFSSFDECEGFGSRPSQEINYTIKPLDPYIGNKNAILTIRLAGLNYSHKINISVNGNIVKVDSFFGFQMREYSIEINNEILKDDLSITIKSNAAGNDLISVSNIRLLYPKKMGGGLLDGEIIKGNSPSNISLKGFDNNHILVTPFDTEWKSPALINGNNYFEIKTGNDKSYFFNIKTPTIVTKLEKIIIEDITANLDYLIITHIKLLASAKEYESYRKSAAGGSFNTKIVTIDQIYNQFGYGMKQVQGLNSYSQYLTKTFPGLHYILIIGRALNYRDLRVDNNATTYNHLQLVPTFGYPGADNLVFSKIGTNSPTISIGRIAASDDNQVRIYLNKIKEYESKLKNPNSNEDLYWRKEILHSAGGIPNGLPNAEGFDLKLDQLKNIIVNTPWQPNVTSTNKASSDIIQGSLSNIIINKVNSGVSIYTYLGHGAISATEIGLDDPDLFNNKGKYPISFVLGCNSGNIHTTGFSLSESFLFSPKGSIAFISSSAVGTDGGYLDYGKILYPKIGNTMYTKSLGDQHYFTLLELDTKQNDVTNTSLVQQMAIHGDPAIQINYYETPDFTIDEKSFKISPENLFTDLDSFQISFILWNIGKKYNTPVKYTIEHLLPDGKVISLNRTVLFDSISKFISLKIPMPSEVEGLNKILIKLDPNQEVNELPNPFAEQNNELRSNNQSGISFNVFANDVHLIYPPDFGIIGKAPIELKAYTSNAFSSVTKYFFELDTTPQFNSSFTKKSTSTQRGGLITWNPPIVNLDNERVYYWRIATDSMLTKGKLLWKSRSFIYINDKGPGWNQSHSGQYVQNENNNEIIFDASKNTWNIKPGAVAITATSINQAIDPAEFSKVTINGDRFTRNNHGFKSEFIITLWDPALGGLDRNPAGGRDGATNRFGSSPGYFFPMETNSIEERKNLIRFLETGIKKGQYVIIINHIENGFSYFPEAWAADSITLGKNLYQVLESKGAKKIRTLAGLNSVPYILVYQEGSQVIDEVVASPDILSIRSAFEVPIILNKGTHHSIEIGPATKWETFEWLVQDIRNNQNNLIITGAGNKEKDTLFISSGQNLDLSSINASAYPLIRLHWRASDTSKTGSLNLKYWRVYFKGFPDLAISANEGFNFYKDTIDQGDIAVLKYQVQNIGDITIDSAKIFYSLENDKNQSILDTISISKLNPLEIKSLSKEFTTENRINTQSISITGVSLSKIQETNLKNNSGKLNFYVAQDKIPPSFNVYFDGKEIFNHEIVARKPRIEVHVLDNKNLESRDSLQFLISLKTPSSDKFIQLVKSEYTILYEKGKATISYNPNFTVSGEYILKVQAKDKAGNIAANNQYEVNFKVITENSISTVLPYPNPFTSKCQFAYTLTGAKPTIFKIQIMTIAGRIIRELTESDLGPMQEGTHLTERFWDGTDEYGNKLATGTYLYRVIAKNNLGETYKSYEDVDSENTADNRKYLTKGIGKLVILR